MWKEHKFKSKAQAEGFKKGFTASGGSTVHKIKKKKGKWIVEAKY